MYRSGQRVVTQAIQKYLGSSYDVVKTVYDNLTLLLGLQNLADNADKVVDVADNLDDVTSVADNLTDVSAVADNIVVVTEVNAKVDDFNTKYLGSYASAPTVDGNGDPLVEGATYWDTTLNAMFVYTGSQWVKPTGTGIVDVDTFTGDGSTASFPLDVSPASKTNTSVFIDGVYQEKDTYSVSTNLITFNTAPNDEASIEVIVNEITNFITGTQTETHTLTSGQTVVNLTNSPAFASFHIQGEDVDSQRLDLGTDYTLDLLTNTITLTNSYPENTVLKMLYGYDDDISVELAPLNQAILDHVNATENAHPASAISLSNGKSLQQEGIPVWDTDTVYPEDALVKGSDGKIYRSVIEQGGNNPVSDDGTNWIGFVSYSSVMSFTDVTTLQSGTSLDGSKVNFQELADLRALVRTRWRDGSRIDGAFYIIWNDAAYQSAFGGAPDGTTDFYVGGGTDYVARMTSDATPRMRIGTNPVVNPAALRDAVYVGRNMEGLTDAHAFTDRTVIDNVTDPGTYGTFDSVTTVQGSHTQSHQFSFQDRAIYNGTGQINNWAGHIVWPQSPGSGIVDQRYGMWFKDVDQMGGGGTINAHIGIFMEDLNNATSNVAFNIQQDNGFTMFAPNSGKWQIGGEFAVTAQAVFGVTVPISGVAATFSRGNIGDQKSFVSSNSGAGTLGVAGDHRLEFISNASNRVVIENSAENYALRPESTTQNLGTTVKSWNINYLKEVNFVPITAASASNLSLFIDSADGNLKYKTSGGTVRTIGFT